MTGALSLVRVWLGRARPNAEAADVGQSVRLSVYGPGAAKTAAVLRRSPVGNAISAGPAGRSEPASTDEHLVAALEETAPPALTIADVIVVRAGKPGAALKSPREVYLRFPGCLVTVFGYSGGCVIETRTGWHLRLVAARSGSCVSDDLAAYASVVHAWMVSGRSLAALDDAYVIGPCQFRTERPMARVIAQNRARHRPIPAACRQAGG
jgi:hypothetical protein